MVLHVDPAGWFWFVMASLATWRCASFLVYDEGPFGIAVRHRRWWARRGAGKLMSCHHCTTVWLAVFWVGVIHRPGIAWLVLIPAVAGAASALERQLSGYDDSLQELEDEE